MISLQHGIIFKFASIHPLLIFQISSTTCHEDRLRLVVFGRCVSLLIKFLWRCHFMSGIALVSKEPHEGSERLGEAGVALHYANVINQINIIVSRNLPFLVTTCSYIWYRFPMYMYVNGMLYANRHLGQLHFLQIWETNYIGHCQPVLRQLYVPNCLRLIPMKRYFLWRKTVSISCTFL